MDYGEIKKISLKVFIAFLSISALIAIVSVLSGNFGELEIKILSTTFTISAASICSMACAAFIEKRKKRIIGLSGIIFSVACACVLIAGIWLEIESKEYWKTMITLAVSSVAFAHAFLLVLPDLDIRHKWVQTVSASSIGVLAVQIITAIWGEINNDNYYRILAVVAIVVGLETLVVPILMKLKKSDNLAKKLLVLEYVNGEIYSDRKGSFFKVTEVSGNGDSREE